MTETYTRVQNVLEHARAVHQQLQQYYEKLADKTRDERIGMLIKYLNRHHQHREDVLKRFEKEVAGHVLDMQIQYLPEPGQAGLFPQSFNLAPDMSAEKVVKTALQMDDYLIQTYASIAAQTACPKVRETIEYLISLVTNEKKRLSIAVEALMEI